MSFCRFATYPSWTLIHSASDVGSVTFHDEILQRMYSSLNVFTPAPAGSDNTPLVKSSCGTIGEPSLKLPTDEKLLTAVCVMTTVCGNACEGGSCCRPGLLLCGLRE